MNPDGLGNQTSRLDVERAGNVPPVQRATGAQRLILFAAKR